jgi:hypothetical protein
MINTSAIWPQLAHKGNKAFTHSKISCTWSTKLLAMMRRNNYEFGSKFHNFGGSREFTMNF